MKNKGFPMEEKEYTVGSGTIHYWVSCQDAELPWLVFLPGLTADHTLFEKQIEFFGPIYNCLVWDAPGHGSSRPFALTFSMEDLADYLQGIFELEKIRRAVLMGQSFGGYIAQVYYSRYPEKVAAFVSVDSCSLSRKYYSGLELGMMKHTGWMYRSIPWKLLKKWGIEGTSVTEYGQELMEKAWSVYTKKEFCALSDHGYRIFAQAVEAKDAYGLACPVLLLCGDQDKAGSAKRYNRRWAKEDAHKILWLQDAGHNANADVPRITNQVVYDYLRGLEKL